MYLNLVSLDFTPFNIFNAMFVCQFNEENVFKIMN